MCLPISKNLIAIAAVTFTLALPEAALAQTPQAGTQAREALREGARLIEKLQYQAALARFQEAYALVPTPKIHYNFGLAYLGLVRQPEALEAFETFLRETPNPPPVQKLKAIEHVERLKQNVMQLTVACNIEGAKVLIDGRLRGLTPLPRAVALDPGAHELLVEHDGGHDPVLKSVFGASGQAIKVEVVLKPKPEAVAPLPLPVAVAAPPPTDAYLRETAQPNNEGSSLVRSPWFWGGVGVVVTAVVVGSILLFSPASQAPDCPPSGINSCLRLQ